MLTVANVIEQLRAAKEKSLILSALVQRNLLDDTTTVTVRFPHTMATETLHKLSEYIKTHAGRAVSWSTILAHESNLVPYMTFTLQETWHRPPHEI